MPHVRYYSGSKTEAYESFRADAAKAAMEGFFPISEVWEEGAWTTGDFIVALLLCLICVGILVFIYMLAVKPNNGTLTVTYEKREEEQTCPKCAERVKVAASVCRFCGHIF